MGKDIKKRFTVSLDIDTKDAEKQIKSTVGNLKTILADLGNASDKMTYFKELANYLSQIDSQLNSFKQKYGENLFDKMFGGLDINLQKEFEGVFGVAKEQLTALDQLKEKVVAAKNNGETTGVDLKPLEQEVRDLYESIGMLDKLDLSGKGKVETRIKKLEAALSGFAVIWDGLNDKVKKGFIFNKQNDSSIGDGIVKDIKDVSKNVENELDKLKKIIKQKVQEVYDAQIDGVDMKTLDKIKKPLYDVLSLSPDDNDFYKIEDIFDELLDNGDEKGAIKKIIAIAEAQQKAKQELDKALSLNDTDQTSVITAPDNIEKDAEATVKVIDIAKKKLIAAWKQYFNDVEEAKAYGYDLSAGESSMQMDATQFSINQMLKEWGAKATKGYYKSNVEFALDLSDYIIDGDIGINDIENEINKMFEENGITVDIPLDKISVNTSKAEASVSKLGDQAQENTQEMASSLGNVEIKTNDVATAFQNLINYISKSGQSPQDFFNVLITGAQTVDDELKNILTSLNLIDSNGGINLKSLSSGFSNSGGMISDDYVLISREQKKLSYSLDAKQKTAEAKALGANIGAVLEVYEDKVNGLIYELQNKVNGEGILDFKKGIVNTDFLNATDDQIKKLIEDLLILQKTGLYVDWNGDNILYDKDKGFSFIDFFTKAVPGVTVGKDNTIQENIETFFDQIFDTFSLNDSDYHQMLQFRSHVNDLMDVVVNNNNAQQATAIISQDIQDSSKMATTSVQQEKIAHEQNTDAINAENQALQAQIELKKKAQSMTWEDFALDESTSDLKKMAGFQSLSDMEKFWKQANYEKSIDFKELTRSETNNILDKDVDFNKLRTAWYSAEKFDAKNKIENAILANDKLRNAAMNKLYQIYKEYVDSAISFDDFLNSEITVYRGDDAPAIYGDMQQLSFSFQKSTADTFGNKIVSTTIVPKETIGSAVTHAFEDETEVFVPISKLPYQKSSLDFDAYYNSLDKGMQSVLDFKLIQQERNKIRSLFGDDLLDAFFDFTNTDVLSKFQQGVVPQKIDLTGEYYNDQFASIYNNLPDIQKKLTAYYSSLVSLAESLSHSVELEYGSTFGLSDKIGQTGLAGVAINDSAGLKQHISQLTGESKYALFGQDTQSIQQETVAHQQNIQSIQQEQQAQQELNEAKLSGQEVVNKLLTSSLGDMWTAKFSGWKNIIDQIEKVNASKNDEIASNVLKDGYYEDPATGELLDYNDLLNSIQNFEQDYGENLSYVKEYLEQVFARYISNTEKLSSGLSEIVLDDDELILDGFDSNNDSSNNLSNSKQELQVQQDITAEKQKQATLDQVEQLDLDTTEQSQDIQNESAALDELLIKVNNVTQAITDKTTAFLDEGDVADQVIQQEIATLQLLLDKLSEVLNNITIINESFTKINAEIAELNGTKDIDVNENITSETTAEKAKEIISQNYALDTTLVETNGILNQILIAIGNKESFSQLIDPLNAAVSELKNVANGITTHQQAQKTNLSDASSRIANQYGQLSSVATMAVSNIGSDIEIKGMKALADNVVRVEGAVRDASGTWNGFIVDINEANQASIVTTNTQSELAKSLNKAAEAVKNVGANTKHIADNNFTQSLNDQINKFDNYRENLQDVSYISDDLKTKLNELSTSLRQVTNTTGLDTWKDSFSEVQKQITLAKDTFTAQQVGKVNQAQKALEASFKTLDFKTTDSNLTAEQQQLVEGYMQAKAVLDAYKKSAQQGNQVELNSIQNVTDALYKQVEAYKQIHNIVNAGGGSKNAHGATAVLNATAKYNLLSQQATGGEFANSKVIQQMLVNYTTAYQRLIAIQNKFKTGENLTDEQIAGFKQAQTECNNYAKELNKVITASQKLASGGTDIELLGGDFEDTITGRQNALTDFIETTYGASAKIGEFKDNFNQLTFAVDNGDGTFTQMTATINAARSAIVATAGDTKKSTSAFGQFFNELKGKFKTISTYLISSFSLQEIWQQIRQGINYVREIDSALTELKKVTDETDATYEKFLQTASKTANIIGSTVADFTNATADFARLGYNIEEASKLAEAASVYKNVGDGIDDVATASESIISTMKAFGIEAENAMGIVDRFNEVGKTIAQVT